MQAPTAGSAAPGDAGNGELVPLRSVLEIDVKIDLVDAVLIEIPARAANDVVNILVAAKAEKGVQIPLSHLRRFVKPHDVPPHLLPQLQERPWSRPGSSSGSSAAQTRTSSRPQSSHSSNSRGYMSRGNLSRAGSIISASELSRASTGNALGSRSSGSTRSRRRKKVDKILYLCTDHDAMSCEKILDTLVEKSIIEKTTPMPTWFPIQVPMRAPRSDAEALDWSQSYWPCFYRPSNDYGPWITIVERAAAEILSRVNLCVQVARDAGKASQLACHGLNSACVIVENGQIICVRGDARFMGLTAGEGVRPDGSRSENILGHAAMRAIGQVGRLRVAAATVTPEKPTDESRDVMGDLTNSMRNSSLKQLANLPNDFLENPISSIERKYDQNSAVDGSGYLCLDMEAYLTHEPCLMCCMAMVHSRIRRVIFAKRMPKTGGLTADERATGERGDAKEANSLGYGLWYRKELNWRQLAWEWRDFLSHQSYDDGVDRDVHV